MDTNKKFQETLTLYQEGKLTEAANAVEKLIKLVHKMRISFI